MTSSKQSTYNQLANLAAPILRYGIAGILVVAPFYAPLTVLLASHFRHFDFLRIWKEIALVGLAAIMSTFLVTHRRRVADILHDKLYLTMLGYAALLSGTAIYDLLSGRVTTDAVIYGLLLDLRLIGFFALLLL